MKVKISVIALIVLLFLVGLPVSGYCQFSMLGDRLVEFMRSYEKRQTDEDFIKGSVYIGFVQGVYDTTVFLYNTNPKSVDQLCAVVAKYLKEHPERWHEPGCLLVADALKEAFPKE